MPNAAHVIKQLAHCGALGMPEAVHWCEELGITVRRVDPIGLVTKRQLELWAAKCVMDKASYMDEICGYILSDDEIMQAGAWQRVSWLAGQGDLMGMILQNVQDGIYASNMLKRDVLAREHVWPEVVAALDGC
jgi:hypothetical protein